MSELIPLHGSVITIWGAVVLCVARFGIFGAEYADEHKQTRREKFLIEMDRLRRLRLVGRD
jgi:hypothetical protein